MQLPTLLGTIVKSGKITVSANDVEAIQISAENNNIDLKIKDKEIIKQLIQGGTGNTSLRQLLNMLKEMAKELKEEEITITVSYNDDVVVTIGSKARPTLSKLVTRSDNIEINSLRRLLQLGL